MLVGSWCNCCCPRCAIHSGSFRSKAISCHSDTVWLMCFWTKWVQLHPFSNFWGYQTKTSLKPFVWVGALTNALELKNWLAALTRRLVGNNSSRWHIRKLKRITFIHLPKRDENTPCSILCCKTLHMNNGKKVTLIVLSHFLGGSYITTRDLYHYSQWFYGHNPRETMRSTKLAFHLSFNHVNPVFLLIFPGFFTFLPV